MSDLVKIGGGAVSGAIIAGVPGLITAAALTTWILAGDKIMGIASGRKDGARPLEKAAEDNGLESEDQSNRLLPSF